MARNFAELEMQMPVESRERAKNEAKKILAEMALQDMHCNGQQVQKVRITQFFSKQTQSQPVQSKYSHSHQFAELEEA